METKLLTRTITLLILGGFLLFQTDQGSAQNKKFEPKLESLQQHKTPEWLQDAKFGIYTHWGPVTWAIRHHEQGNFGWYGRSIYKDGSPQKDYHTKHYGDPKSVGYKDLFPRFTAPKFDAEEWAELIADAGAKFGGPVSIHHDNFAMWASDIHRWNAKATGPKRDIAGELEKAFRKRNMKFIGAFHHGFTYHFWEFARKAGYDGSNAEFSDLYGPVDERDKQKKFIPREFQQQWLDLVNEFNTKYKPDLIYFDFGLGWQDKDIQYQMYANYYNAAEANGQKVTVLQKERDDIQRTISTMDLERGRMDELTDYTWTTDTSPGPWFYHKNPAHEDSNTMIDMMIDIVSKNGVMLLNVAPDFEGSIPREYRTLLKDFGSWFKVNGEGIYNTRPFKIYGEGTVATGAGHFKIENSTAKKEATYSASDIRYTRSKDNKTVYAFLLGWPKERSITFNALSIKQAITDAQVALLGYDKPLRYKVNANKTITVELPIIAIDKRPTDFAHGLKFSGFTIKPHPSGHFYLPSVISVPAKNAAIHGWSMKQTPDSKGETRIHNWSAWWGSSHWLFTSKLKNRTTDLRCRMINRNNNSELLVTIFNQQGEKHELKVKPAKTGNQPSWINLGQVQLKKDGVYHLSIGSKADKLSRNAIDIYELQVAPLPKK